MSWDGGEYQLNVEERLGEETIEQLRRMGHKVVVEKETGFGRGQIVVRLPNGVLCGASDKRGDGCAIGF